MLRIPRAQSLQATHSPRIPDTSRATSYFSELEGQFKRRRYMMKLLTHLLFIALATFSRVIPSQATSAAMEPEEESLKCSVLTRPRSLLALTIRFLLLLCQLRSSIPTTLSPLGVGGAAQEQSQRTQ